MAPKPTPRKPSKPQQPSPRKKSKAKTKDADQDRRIAALERREAGPKAENSFTCTVNLGTIADPGAAFSRVASVFLNPALLRDAEQTTDATTPLTTRASQYGLWRVRRGEVRAMPLVGNSGVAGTVALLTMQANAGHCPATTFDAVAARRHTSGGVGKDLRFKFAGKEVKGPQHGWFFTNTATGPGQDTLGPTVEIYTLGACKNIYTNQDFTGPLWRLTLSATFEFANYQNNPGLAEMHSADARSEVTITTDAEGVVSITPGNPALRLRAPQGTGLGDVVLSLTESVSHGLEGVPVLGPLLRTGVAFLRPFLSNLREPVSYKVYPNFEAARLGQPLRLAPNQTYQANGNFTMQQLTPVQNAPAATRSINPEVESYMPSPRYEVAPISRPSDALWFAFCSVTRQKHELGPVTTQFTTTASFKGSGDSWPGAGRYASSPSNRWHWPGTTAERVWRFELRNGDGGGVRWAPGIIGTRNPSETDSPLLAPLRYALHAVPDAEGEQSFGWRETADYPWHGGWGGGPARVLPVVVELCPITPNRLQLYQLAGYLVARDDWFSLDLAADSSMVQSFGMHGAVCGYLLPDYGFMPIGQRTTEIPSSDPWAAWGDSSARSRVTERSPSSSGYSTMSSGRSSPSSLDD